LEFFSSTFYFKSFGIHISDTAYFKRYVIPISGFILLINLYYNFNSKSKLTIAEPAVEEVGDPEVKIETEIVLTEHMDGKEAKICDYTSITETVYISIVNKKLYAIDKNGDAVDWTESLVNSIAALPKDEFFQICRNIIIHRSIIDKITTDNDTKEVTVMLKKPFKHNILLPKAAVMAFKIWCTKNTEIRWI